MRSASFRSEQQVPIWSRPFSVINEQDSNRRHSSLLQWSAIATRALSVTEWQHVRSTVLNSGQHVTSSEMQSSVTPLHLPSPISSKFLQWMPMIRRLAAETWKPSIFNTFKVPLITLNLERKSGTSSYNNKFIIIKWQVWKKKCTEIIGSWHLDSLENSPQHWSFGDTCVLQWPRLSPMCLHCCTVKHQCSEISQYYIDQWKPPKFHSKFKTIKIQSWHCSM